ncbi:MAG TPA: hypothetical protein PLD25_16525 [Chloroflexota bacterium]|nr:hypothetical protein [Chloroflexota bacterium]
MQRENILLLLPPWLGVVLAVVATLFVLPVGPGYTAFDPSADASPTPDPLATPELPENPTALELGRYSYYYNCMPCHGDKGQGLTDEWRQVWVEDHQNCWARGCHAGLPNDLGFPLPETIPPVMNTSSHLSRFDTTEELLAYLSATHPPQRPGVLPDDEYDALTTLLWAENGRLSQNEGQPTPRQNLASSIILFGVAVVVIFGALILYAIASLARRRH